jgi:hypothetical protein
MALKKMKSEHMGRGHRGILGMEKMEAEAMLGRGAGKMRFKKEGMGKEAMPKESYGEKSMTGEASEHPLIKRMHKHHETHKKALDAAHKEHVSKVKKELEAHKKRHAHKKHHKKAAAKHHRHHKKEEK